MALCEQLFTLFFYWAGICILISRLQHWRSGTGTMVMLLMLDSCSTFQYAGVSIIGIFTHRRKACFDCGEWDENLMTRDC